MTLVWRGKATKGKPSLGVAQAQALAQALTVTLLHCIVLSHQGLFCAGRHQGNIEHT